MLSAHSIFQSLFLLFKFGFAAQICPYVGKIHLFWSNLLPKQPQGAPGENSENSKIYLEGERRITLIGKVHQNH